MASHHVALHLNVDLKACHCRSLRRGARPGASAGHYDGAGLAGPGAAPCCLSPASHRGLCQHRYNALSAAQHAICTSWQQSATTHKSMVLTASCRSRYRQSQPVNLVWLLHNKELACMCTDMCKVCCPQLAQEQAAHICCQCWVIVFCQDMYAGCYTCSVCNLCLAPDCPDCL